MRNRAKCNLCKDVIESTIGYVQCGCGEICVDTDMRCGSKDWSNFIRVDDEGNEIIVKIVEKESVKPLDIEEPKKLDKKELLGMLDRMIQSIEGLPPQAMQTYINHYDFCSALILIRTILND